MKDVKFKIKMSAILLVLCGIFSTLGLSAQTGSTINIKGSIVDSDGEPAMGATVRVQNGTAAAAANFDGIYNLTNVPAQGTLEVSYVGHKKQLIPINGRTTIDVVMEKDMKVLGEVMVIGYGTVKKEDATGSVIAIKPDEENKGLITNAQDMIVGKIAGVSVISDGGTPGGSAQIRIRGGSSLNASNDPLIVIDGFPMDNDGVKGLANPLSMVNPNDIETFTVLKDASATAIYGSRASNGVIIITTKRGSKGSAPRVSYNGNVSASSVGKTLDVMNGDEFRSYVNNLYAGQTDILNKLGTENTDWQDAIYRTGVSTDHNITLTGSLDVIPYRFSFGYTNQNGTLRTSNFERYTGSLSLSPTIIENRLTMNMNVKFMYAKNKFAEGGAVGSAVNMDPTKPIYSNVAPYSTLFGGYYQWDVDGTSLNDPTWTRTMNSLATKNPVSMLNLKDDTSKSKSLIANAEADYNFGFLPDLKWHGSAGADISSGNQTTIIDRTSATNNYYGHYGSDYQYKTNFALNTYLQYAKEIGIQNVDVMGGYEWQHFYRRGDYLGYGTTLPTNASNPNSMVNYSNTFWKTENYLVSFFGRLNYSLFDKYLLTATVRYDGSSRFIKEERWGLFPSLAFAWKIKEESFLKDVNVLSDLKLRLGYGVTGQQNIGENYAYIPVYTENKEGAYYPLGGVYYPTYRPDAYNKLLKWEETTTYNVGVDVAFLNNRISASADYYFRKTDDLLNNVQVAAGTNFDNEVISNIGSLENKGFEFMINAKPIVTRDFTWDLGFNLTTNDNKITKLTAGVGNDDYYVATGGISTGTGGNIQAHKVGYAARSFYVFQQVYDADGNPLENTYVDRNGDGVINDNDKYIYKNPVADYLMGLTSKFGYKNWDLGFSLRASLGNYVYNDVLASQANVGASGIWSTSGFFTNRTYDAIALGFNGLGNYHMSDYFVENASFLRMDNITLGYSFPKLFGQNISGRVYGTVQNVFVITKYSGLDPELNSGIDNNIYPRPLVGIFGVNLNF